jgi:hypothetical protein
MAAGACLWVAALAALGPARILLLERVDVLLHVALTTTANRSRRIITAALSLAAVALCTIPHVPLHTLHIEPELMKTFEALDEGTKVTCDMCRVIHRVEFVICRVATIAR